jgi:hypothetical protein
LTYEDIFHNVKVGRASRMTDEKNETKYAYLDLLDTALTDHEKNLNVLIERIEKITEKLSRLNNRTKTPRATAVSKTKVTTSDEEVGTLLQEARDILSY